MNNDQQNPPPTLQEQAQAYAVTKIDGKYPGPVQAYLAGHASRNEEIDLLERREVAWSQKVKQLEDEIEEKESIIQLLKEGTIVELRARLHEATKKYDMEVVDNHVLRARIKELEGNGSTIADTEGQKGGGC